MKRVIRTVGHWLYVGLVSEAYAFGYVPYIPEEDDQS